jgi:hypothetical protein
MTLPDSPPQDEPTPDWIPWIRYVRSGTIVLGILGRRFFAICSRSMNIQVDEYSGWQIFMSTNIHVDKYSGQRIFRSTNIQVDGYLPYIVGRQTFVWWVYGSMNFRSIVFTSVTKSGFGRLTTDCLMHSLFLTTCFLWALGPVWPEL